MRARLIVYLAMSGILLVALLSGVPSATTSLSNPNGQPGKRPNATFDVSIVNFQFQPASLTIHIGDTVTWTNNTAMTDHTSTSDTLVWDSGTLTPGQSFSFTFNSLGVFPYHCNIHHSMTASITVVDLSTPLVTATLTPTVTRTPTHTPAATKTSTPTFTPTDTPTGTVGPTLTDTATSTPGPSLTPTDTPTPTETLTGSETPTLTPTPTATPEAQNKEFIPVVMKAPTT